MGRWYLEYVWIIKLSILFQLVWQSNALAGNIMQFRQIQKKLGIIAIMAVFQNFI